MLRCIPKPIIAAAISAIGLISYSIVLPATAQDASQGAGANMVTEFKGALKSFERGMLIVVREDGTEVMVQLPDDPSAFTFVAEAKPPFLRQGMLVRFSGTFTAAGQATAPIETVTVIQPPTGRLTGRAREMYTPGVHGERRGRNEPVPATAQVTVVGGLLGLDNTGIAVQAGNIPVRAPMSPDAKIEIRFNHLSLAQENDPVSVSGFYQPPDDTKVKAERVTVTTDRIYGEQVDTKPVRATRRSRRTKDAKPDADGGDAALGGVGSSDASSSVPAE
ncbi:hypothetical protein K227x_49370 [Rubripirellula lacrimiformis]|uniref:DUF5666 domain-containing protein n=2 Tax=Rubripirellula lacrimiformis TaxID=1930273 RepID=A0A517NHB4_9BACT|nr:hypothetical protein K227x_49370 [Rubripirellula lacrimiformis]